MLTPGELLETFDTAQTAHAALVHGPVVLTAVALGLAAASAFALGRVRWLRWGALVACGLAAGATFAATQTGETAEGEMGDPPQEARRVVDEHKVLGDQTLWLTGAAFGLAALAFAPGKAVAGAGAWLALAASGWGAWWAASAAHHGGQLVYTYGVGTPKPLTPADLAPASGRATSGDPRIDAYRREVEPILSRYCFSCHGSVDNPASGLSLTTGQGLLSGGDTGAAVIPGDPEGSLLYQVVRGEHPEVEAMPIGPRQLTEAEIETLRRWIADGAVWARAEE